MDSEIECDNCWRLELEDLLSCGEREGEGREWRGILLGN